MLPHRIMLPHRLPLVILFYYTPSLLSHICTSQIASFASIAGRESTESPTGKLVFICFADQNVISQHSSCMKLSQSPPSPVSLYSHLFFLFNARSLTSDFTCLHQPNAHCLTLHSRRLARNMRKIARKTILLRDRTLRRPRRLVTKSFSICLLLQSHRVIPFLQPAQQAPPQAPAPPPVCPFISIALISLPASCLPHFSGRNGPGHFVSLLLRPRHHLRKSSLPRHPLARPPLQCVLLRAYLICLLVLTKNSFGVSSALKQCAAITTACRGSPSGTFF